MEHTKYKKGDSLTFENIDDYHLQQKIKRSKEDGQFYIKSTENIKHSKNIGESNTLLYAALVLDILCFGFIIWHFFI
jgi:hypothetical protein